MAARARSQRFSARRIRSGSTPRDSADRRARLTLPNGVTTDYSYDAASDLAGLTYANGQSTLGDLPYGYGAAGDRTDLYGSFVRTSLPDAVASAPICSPAWGSTRPSPAPTRTELAAS